MDTTELDGGGEHLAPLSSDNVPDANQAHYCFSCEAPIKGLYCGDCGQKNDDYRRSIFSLLKEVFQAFTALEGRIWRTWAALLFKPGKVARQFADGRRTYWSTPVRVYLAMSILLFGFLNMSGMQLISVDLDVKPKAGIEKPLDELTADDLNIVPALHFFETSGRIEARNATRNFDLIARKIEGSDGLTLDISTDDGLEVAGQIDDYAEQNEDLSPEERDQLKAVSDRLKSGGDTKNEDGEEEEEEQVKPGGMTFSNIDGKVYHLDSWSGIALKLVQDPSTLNAAFYKYLPRIIFLMMSISSLFNGSVCLVALSTCAFE